MKPVLRRTVPSATLALLATLVLAGSVVAAPPSWTAAVNVRTANNIQLYDADFAGHNVAIAWDEPGSKRRRVGYAFSDDNGASFSSPPFMANSREPAIVLCDGVEPNAAFARRVGPGDWTIHRTVFDSFDSSFTDQVYANEGIQHHPDIACAGGRLFISWYEQEGDGDRLFLAHEERGSGAFGPPFDLGFDNETFFFNALAVAGTDDMAYVVFQRSDGDLRLRRYHVGPGPEDLVTGLGGQIVAPGNPGDPASYAVIAASGDKVALAWFRCNALYARVSNNSGATWGPIRKLLDTASCDGDFAASVNSINIRGNRIVVTYNAASAFGGGQIGLFRTNNDFASFSDDPITTDWQPEHIVGYLTVGGKVKLAAAFQRDDNVRFRRQE